MDNGDDKRLWNGGAITASLALIMAGCKAVGKQGRNSGQGFDYRKIEDVVDMLHPLFAEHKVYVATDILDERTEERKTSKGGTLIYRVLRVKVSFVSGVDGSRESVVVIGEGMDSGDKAANKAMTAALKYAVSQTFVLPYAMVDGDKDTHPESVPADKPADKPAAAAGPPQPIALQDALITRMAADGISNIQMIRYCQGKTFLPKDGNPTITELPDKLIEKMLEPANWAKVKAAIAEQPKPELKNATPVKPDACAFNAQLYTAMEVSGISRDELHAYLIAKKFITHEQTIDTLPAKFVDKMLDPANWGKIAAAIAAQRKAA